MRLILLEALAALVLLVGIVWWTMFSGRHGGELEDAAVEPQTPVDPPVLPVLPASAVTATPRETPPPH